MRRSSRSGRRLSLGYMLGNLAGVLIELGRLEEALSPGREALQLLREADHAFVFMDHFAVRAALVGKFSEASMIAGYADRVRAARNAAREPSEARARSRLRALLEAHVAPARLEQFLAAGAAMSEDEACRLAAED
jgi:hypothetical protein